MKAIVSEREFNSYVEDEDGEVLAECLTATKALVFAASEDLQTAVRAFLSAKTAGEGNRAMQLMKQSLEKSTGGVF